MTDFIEGYVPPEKMQDFGRKQIRDYWEELSLIRHVLDQADEDAWRRLDELHRRTMRHIVDGTCNNTTNGVEQMALTAMLGISLLSTFDAQVDYAEFQLDMMGGEE